MAFSPSLRLKKRYLVYQVESSQVESSRVEAGVGTGQIASHSADHSEQNPKNLDFSVLDMQQAVQVALFSFLGQWGVAQAGPRFLPELSDQHQFVLKVQASAVDQVKAALLFIKKIKNTPVLLRTITVSGILKKARSRGGIHATTKANDR